MENNSTENDGEPSLELLVGCKPLQGKILEIEILCSSNPVFSLDSEYGFKKT